MEMEWAPVRAPRPGSPARRLEDKIMELDRNDLRWLADVIKEELERRAEAQENDE